MRGPQPAEGGSPVAARNCSNAFPNASHASSALGVSGYAPCRALKSDAAYGKIWATDDRAKRAAGGGRGLVIIQGYAREHALLDIVRERLERERLNLTLKRERLQGDAKCRRHR